MQQDDSVKAGDDVSMTVAPSSLAPRWARVKVLVESGIFKNGQQYNQGDEAVFALQSAQRFEAVGEVQIVGEVGADGQLIGQAAAPAAPAVASPAAPVAGSQEGQPNA